MAEAWLCRLWSRQLMSSTSRRLVPPAWLCSWSLASSSFDRPASVSCQMDSNLLSSCSWMLRTSFVEMIPICSWKDSKCLSLFLASLIGCWTLMPTQVPGFLRLAAQPPGLLVDSHWILSSLTPNLTVWYQLCSCSSACGSGSSRIWKASSIISWSCLLKHLSACFGLSCPCSSSHLSLWTSCSGINSPFDGL